MANSHSGSIRHSIFVQVKGEEATEVTCTLKYVFESLVLICLSVSHSGSLLAGQTYEPGAGPGRERAPGVPRKRKPQNQHPVADQRTAHRQ